ncbi:uncharacterized protein TNCT_525631 [Trichonephila clavata]|uniref:Uncharacterized protein n=1 Tax=Trichonephila clavata TaxID=2740835 RepID=A0A8X6K596_TRICU|nr:uncharacterized protein TNCT_525631 [Trichonephila clavata]
MEYSQLIINTLNVPVLKKAIHGMAAESGMLNLVDPDWEKKLEDYPVDRMHVEKQVSFSKGHACHVDKAYVRNIANPLNSYKIIVVALMSCDRTKSKDSEGLFGDLNFIAKECPPLTLIGQAMRETTQHKMHDAARLFKETCSPVLCNTCRTAHQKHHIPCDIHRNWCVMTTRMFDGENLTNAFKKQLEPILEGIETFLAICQLQIYSRTTFGEDKYKSGGKIKNMIIFQESAIQPPMEMTFIQSVSLPVAIEYNQELNEEGTQNVY